MTMTAPEAAHLLNSNDNSEFWDTVMDGQSEIDIDFRLTDSLDTGSSDVIALGNFGGLLFHDGHRWAPVTYPADYRDPQQWQKLAERHEATLRSNRRKNSLREGLFLS